MGHLQPHRMFSVKVTQYTGEIVQGKKFIIPLVYALLPNKKSRHIFATIRSLAVEPMRNYDGLRNCDMQFHQAAQPSCGY